MLLFLVAGLVGAAPSAQVQLVRRGQSPYGFLRVWNWRGRSRSRRKSSRSSAIVTGGPVKAALASAGSWALYHTFPSARHLQKARKSHPSAVLIRTLVLVTCYIEGPDTVSPTQQGAARPRPLAGRDRGRVITESAGTRRAYQACSFNNSSFNVPRLVARRRTGMTRAGQRICRLMCYLTLRVVSPPRPFLIVASLRRVPAQSEMFVTQQLRLPP
jgi:hypothetical protein